VKKEMKRIGRKFQIKIRNDGSEALRSFSNESLHGIFQLCMKAFETNCSILDEEAVIVFYWNSLGIE
jgi:hypothetical protein